MRLITVVDDILQFNACLRGQILEPLLIVDTRNTRDLSTVSFLLCPPVDVVGRQTDGQLASTTVARKVATKGVPHAITADDHVKGYSRELACYG